MTQTPMENLATLRFFTETGSIHEIDMKAGTYVRLQQGPDSLVLRRDGELMQLVRCTRPTLGERVELILRLREDGMLTNRTTAPVIRIEER